MCPFLNYITNTKKIPLFLNLKRSNTFQINPIDLVSFLASCAGAKTMRIYIPLQKPNKVAVFSNTDSHDLDCHRYGLS